MLRFVSHVKVLAAMLILFASGRLEKPRSDFKELVVHHIVTLWLVGWSCGSTESSARLERKLTSLRLDLINLTMIGTAIFVSMDVPDICLAVRSVLSSSRSAS